jgi:hypothetical protein
MSKEDAVLEDRRAAFCARLKTLRESKGVTLEAIAASTKIGRTLLKGLEENDLSRWPHGIYRRAYVRDYLRAIDLLEESVVAEFVRLFPDVASPCPDAPAVVEPGEPGTLTLTLAEGRSARFARARTHIAAATIDLIAVLGLSGAAWWLVGGDIWASGAVVALGYYSIGTAALGRSAGSRMLEDHSWRRAGKTATAAAAAPQDGLLARLREAKELAGQPEPAVTGGLFGVLVAGIIRTLFLR